MRELKMDGSQALLEVAAALQPMGIDLFGAAAAAVLVRVQAGLLLLREMVALAAQLRAGPQELSQVVAAARHRPARHLARAARAKSSSPYFRRKERSCQFLL
jgi:hypothetical protein